MHNEISEEKTIIRSRNSHAINYLLMKNNNFNKLLFPLIVTCLLDTSHKLCAKQMSKVAMRNEIPNAKRKNPKFEKGSLNGEMYVRYIPTIVMIRFIIIRIK